MSRFSLEDLTLWKSNLRDFERYVGKSYYSQVDLWCIVAILQSQIRILLKYCEVGT